jgi:hypothetical protein
MTATAQMWIDRTRNFLAFFLIGSFVGAAVALTFRAIPAPNKDLLTYMVGQLSGMATMALGYYFTKGAGQDSIDATRAENTGKLADAVKAAATGGNGATPETVAGAADHVAGAAVEAADEVKLDL